MIRDLIVSFRENFKEKTTNPFLSLYISILIIRKWDIIYAIFNFDESLTLQQKLDYIKEYMSKSEFIESLGINILWTFAVLIVTYILVNLSRFIVNFSDKQITPWIYKITDSNSIVLKSVYNRVRRERDEIQIRLDKERENNSRLEATIKKLEDKLTIPLTKKDETPQENETDDFINFDKPTIAIHKRLKESNQLELFVKIAVNTLKGEHYPDTYTQIDEFIKLGLFKYTSRSNSGKQYTLTNLGKNVMDLINILEQKSEDNIL